MTTGETPAPPPGPNANPPEGPTRRLRPTDEFVGLLGRLLATAWIERQRQARSDPPLDPAVEEARAAIERDGLIVWRGCRFTTRQVTVVTRQEGGEAVEQEFPTVLAAIQAVWDGWPKRTPRHDPQAGMSAYHAGDLYWVVTSREGVERWNRSWPCSELVGPLLLVFDKRTGDLVLPDVGLNIGPGRCEGEGADRFILDARAFGRRALDLGPITA